MKTNPEILTMLIQVCASAQIGVAVLNLSLIRLLKWKAEIERMSLLPRQVFVVHLWFISVTLLIFGVISWRFAEEMVCGLNPVATWFAGAIAVFWGIRTVLQLTYYSSEHWKGKRREMIAHVLFLAIYAGLTVTYGAVVM